MQNTGLLGNKPPYFQGKTSELYLQEVRCFWILDGQRTSEDIRFIRDILCLQEKNKDRNQSLALDAKCVLVDSINSLCQVFELFLLYNYLGNATFVSCARQSANKFARCARLAKRSFAHHT